MKRKPYLLTGELMQQMRHIHYGLSQAKLAAKLKIHVQFVSNWERGTCAPPEHVLKKLIPKGQIPNGPRSWRVEFFRCMLNDRALSEQAKFRKMGFLNHDLFGKVI